MQNIDFQLLHVATVPSSTNVALDILLSKRNYIPTDVRG